MNRELSSYDQMIATAIIGVDTLWGGDVMNPSGVGRFVADTWFSGQPLPPCYYDDSATRLRLNGGVLGRTVSNSEIIMYVDMYDLRRCISALKASDRGTSLRTKYLDGLGRAFEVMLDMALATRDLREPVSYREAILAATGQLPREASFSSERKQVADLLGWIKAGPGQHSGDLVKAVDAWRAQRLVKPDALAATSARLVTKLDQLTVAHILPHLPEAMRMVPRTNVTFLPIKNTHFSGSLNYLGRARHDDGTPKYEATYEINAHLQISEPEFEALIAHEVVPGHILNLALLHYLYHTGAPGFEFETTVLTACTPATTLAEGIANNAILLAHGVRTIEDVKTIDLMIGILLTRLHDIAKARISFQLHAQHLPWEEVMRRAREECLVTPEAARRLTLSWGAHPLLSQMYMPIYAVGTDIVATLLDRHGFAKVIPAVYGVHGPVDCTTLRGVIESLPD